MDSVQCCLYVNGFTFQAQTEGAEVVAVSFAPFVLVRNCKFQSSYASIQLDDFKIFKVSLFAHAASYYFAVKKSNPDEAEQERSQWVADIARAIRLVTRSLFPAHSMTSSPVPDVQSTQSRLLAGYLVHFDDCFVASLVYAELHPHWEDAALFVAYENESCLTKLLELRLTLRTVCCEKIGINCSCFSIEEHQFSARSQAERKVWLRAISNLKVKLQNRAPCPTAEELVFYRQAIREHLLEIKSTIKENIVVDPLLQQVKVQQQRSAFSPREVSYGDFDRPASPFKDDDFPPCPPCVNLPAPDQAFGEKLPEETQEMAPSYSSRSRGPRAGTRFSRIGHQEIPQLGKG